VVGAAGRLPRAEVVDRPRAPYLLQEAPEDRAKLRHVVRYARETIGVSATAATLCVSSLPAVARKSAIAEKRAGSRTLWLLSSILGHGLVVLLRCC
jgi:hypothetical protein